MDGTNRVVVNSLEQLVKNTVDISDEDFEVLLEKKKRDIDTFIVRFYDTTVSFKGKTVESMFPLYVCDMGISEGCIEWELCWLSPKEIKRKD